MWVQSQLLRVDGPYAGNCGTRYHRRPGELRAELRVVVGCVDWLVCAMATVVLRSGGEGHTSPNDNKSHDKSHRSRPYTQCTVIKSFSVTSLGENQKHSVLHRLTGGHMNLQTYRELQCQEPGMINLGSPCGSDI